MKKLKRQGKVNLIMYFVLQHIQNIVIAALINIKDIMNEIVDILKIVSL